MAVGTDELDIGGFEKGGLDAKESSVVPRPVNAPTGVGDRPNNSNQSVKGRDGPSNRR